MSSTHSAEFKAKVALEAVSNPEGIAEIAGKYDLSEDQVNEWMQELKLQASNVFESKPGEVSDYEIQSDDETFIHSLSFGAQDDQFNYRKLFFWSGLGIATVVVFVVSLIFFAQYSFDNAQKNASVTSSYYEITQLTEDAEAHLSSYGVVDLEEGVYRIPIDEAINKLAVDEE